MGQYSLIKMLTFPNFSVKFIETAHEIQHIKKIILLKEINCIMQGFLKIQKLCSLQISLFITVTPIGLCAPDSEHNTH